jgi:fibronectin-binding autotransporter adhesin
LTKAGTDSFVAVLTQANTYAGTTTVGNGILSLGAVNCLPTGSAITINPGAAITMPLFSYPGVTPGSYNQSFASLSGGGNLEIGGATITIGSAGISTTFSGGITDFGSSGSLIKVGNNTLTLTGGCDYTGTTTVNAGSLQIGNNTTTGSLVSNIVNNASVVFNRSDTSTFPGVLSGTGAVNKTGGGTLFLSNVNTFTNNPSVTGGALRAVDGVGLPSNVNLTLNGGSWEPTTATLTRALGTGAGQIRLTGGASGFSAFGQTLNVDVGGNGTGTGPALTWGNVNFNPSSLILNAATANSTLDLKNALVITAAASRTITVNANAAVASISGVISGTSPWTKNGNGALLLRNNANSFTGAITVTAGILNATNDGQLGAAPTAATPSKITLNGGTLQAGGDFATHANRGLAIGANNGTIATQGFNLTYAGAITGTGAITKSGSGSLTLGPSNTGYSGPITLTQAGTLIAGADGSLGSSIATNTITFNNGTLLTTGAIANPTRNLVIAAGSGTINTNGFDSTFNTVTGAASGTLTKTGSGALTVGSVRITGTTATLTVSAGKLALAPNGQAAGVSTVNALTLGAGAQVDLSDNHLIVKTTPVGSLVGSTYTGLTGLIASGRTTANTWTGAGLITSQSSAANPSNYTSLGIATAAQVEGIAGTVTAVWAGLTVAASDALVMYTYGGDANLDGKLSILDYVLIDQGLAAGLSGWINGDFNYDGIVNVLDYTIIDGNLPNQGPAFFATGGIDAGGPSGVSAVPEPVAGALLLLPALALVRRRRDIHGRR